MYNLPNAARALGVSVSTVKRWMTEYGIDKKVIETDRKRVYLSYDDILTLANKHRPLTGDATDQKKNYPDTTGLYTLAKAARLLGVKYSTVRQWIVESNIEKKIITTDKKRAYVSYSSLVDLAEKHNRTIAYDNVTTEQESNAEEASPSQKEKLYTIAEASIVLGASERAVREWLSLYNIEKKTIATNGRRVYITYDDLAMLASKRKREGVYPVNIANDIREMRNRLEKIEEGIVNLEKYIKRSIYLGK